MPVSNLIITLWASERAGFLCCRLQHGAPWFTHVAARRLSIKRECGEGIAGRCRNATAWDPGFTGVLLWWLLFSVKVSLHALGWKVLPFRFREELKGFGRREVRKSRPERKLPSTMSQKDAHSDLFLHFKNSHWRPTMLSGCPLRAEGHESVTLKWSVPRRLWMLWG